MDSTREEDDTRASYNHEHRDHGMRRVFSLLLIPFLLIIGVILTRDIMQYTNTPKLPEFQLVSASFSPFNTTIASSASWDVNLSAHNPSKKFIVHYGGIQVSLFYRNILISESVFAPFDQGKKSNVTLHAKFNVANDGVVKDISQFHSGGVVNLNMHVVINEITFKGAIGGGWWTGPWDLDIWCMDLEAMFSTTSGAGILYNGPIKCR